MHSKALRYSVYNHTGPDIYELLAAGWEGDVHSDLKALLDLMTPLYKARMEHPASCWPC